MNNKLKDLKRVDFKELEKFIVSSMYSYLDSRREEPDIRGSNIKVNALSVIMTVYASYFLKKNDESDIIFLKKSNMKDELKRLFINNAKEFWSLIQIVKEKFTLNELLGFILFSDAILENRYDIATPKTIIKLSNKILKVEKNDRVLELCSGEGNYLIETYFDQQEAFYKGVEINYMKNAIAYIKSLAIDANIELILYDVFEFSCEYKFDKLFSNYPFAIRNMLSEHTIKNLSLETGLNIKVLKSSSMEWLFNLLMIKNITKEGKAIGIMTNGSLWKKADQEIRKYFINNGYIEAIISLPEKMFKNAIIPTNLIVLSRNNYKIKMVDASSLGVKVKTQTLLSAKDIDLIISSMSDESDISTFSSINNVELKKYVLSPMYYMKILPEPKDGVKLGKLIKKLTRGAQLKVRDLDAIKSEVETPFKLMNISCIKDGYIEFNNDYLKEIPEGNGKYCVKNNNIVLSKSGSHFFKSAIVELNDDIHVLATGNIYILEVDENKINPQYLQAFLVSEIGQVSIKSVIGGGVLPVISISQLKNIIIPLPSMEVQNSIAVEYMSAIDEIALLKRKYETKREVLRHIYEGGYCV